MEEYRIGEDRIGSDRVGATTGGRWGNEQKGTK